MGFLIFLVVLALVVYFNLERITPLFAEVWQHYKVVYCAHEYDREVNNDGYQFCVKCKAARLVGLPECQHVWETLEKYKVTDSISKAVVKHVYVQKCTKCGKMNNHET